VLRSGLGSGSGLGLGLGLGLGPQLSPLNLRPLPNKVGLKRNKEESGLELGLWSGSGLE